MKHDKEKYSGKTDIYLYESRQDMLFFYYNAQHPKTDIANNFSLGRLRLYTNKKLYSSQFTNGLLNPALNWGEQLYKRLLKNFRSFCIYTEKDQYGQSFLQIAVYQKINSKTICLCKIKVVQDFTSDITTDLWNQFQKYNKFQCESIMETEDEIQILKQNVQMGAMHLEDLQFHSERQVNLVKGKLSILLHEKENKLAELSGNKVKFNYQNNKEQKMQSSSLEFISSQDDRILIGSLFQSSQQYR